jgi:hypothetical protein
MATRLAARDCLSKTLALQFLLIHSARLTSTTSGSPFANVATAISDLEAVDKAVTVEPVGEFALKGIRRPMMTYNVLEPLPSKPN